MKRIIDLHTHSSVSDGTMKPRELVIHAKNNNISVLSITDHDTIDGIEEALEEARKVGITFIPGVEISVDFKNDMHILGYFREDNFKNIVPLLEILKQNRSDRNPKMIEKLNSIGIQITAEDVQMEAEGELIARLHFAKALVKKGYAIDTEDAFKKYLTRGKPGYVRKEKISAECALSEIKKAGGVPVLAHPIFMGVSFDEIENLLENSLINAGLAGIEVYYVENSEEQTQKSLELCKKHSLIATGGSDFHGNNKSWIEIGIGKGTLCVDYELAEILLKKMNRLS